MRTRGVPVAALLLLVALVHQATGVEDLYWEGEEDRSNEFLEVKPDEFSLSAHLTRLKRAASFFSSASTEGPSPDIYDSVTEDDDTAHEGKDDDIDADGSGLPDHRIEPELREKTLRVTFVVMEPYNTEYSNRDSIQFQNFSKSLADAVNALFETLPGTQKASLVRIQSRLADEFTCKVTLDIVTTGYEDTNRIAQTLRDHIKMRSFLGTATVTDTDFSAIEIDPGSTPVTCASNELQCDDGSCIIDSARCNGRKECPDGSDEAGCNNSVNNYDQGPDSNGWDSQNCSIPCSDSVSTYCDSQKCDGHEDCPDGDDEIGCPFHGEPETQRGDQSLYNEVTPGLPEEDTNFATTPLPQACYPGELRCDETRCVSASQRCDSVFDCDDGTDEQGCPETCGADDFRCDNGMCIEGARRCDRIVDCPGEEDEKSCQCTADEFQCGDDGSCIELRKLCDGTNNCLDGSDERNCATGYFKCRTGKLIPDSLRCNRRYDCPSGDYSDEQNCPCDEGDFKCDNGHCIPASKHCDRTHDCQDGSDERHCTYGTVCMAYQFKCTSGKCVQADSWCNGTVECDDASDEMNCPCKRGQFQCHDGSCINIALRCNGRKDCHPSGEDEFNCEVAQCPPDSFTCDARSSVRCATACDNNPECDGSEDEADCPGCNHECDGKCLDDQLICNSVPDCSDGSDELNCDNCDRPSDFRCDNGECLNIAQKCNGIKECPSGNDEQNCNTTLVPTSGTCSSSQFTCHDGTCVDVQFTCDGQLDCTDGSDEENCPCDANGWQCRSGQCIPYEKYCDTIVDCEDSTDEMNCTLATTTNAIPSFPASTLSPIFTTTQRDYGRPDQDPQYPYPPRQPSPPSFGSSGSGSYGETTPNPSIPPSVDVPNVGDDRNQYENRPPGENPYPDDLSSSYDNNRGDQSENEPPRGDDDDDDQYANKYPDGPQYGGGGDDQDGYGTTGRPQYGNGNDNGYPDEPQYGGNREDVYGNSSPRGDGSGGYPTSTPRYDRDDGDQYGYSSPRSDSSDQFGNGAPNGGQYGGEGSNPQGSAPSGRSPFGGDSSNTYNTEAPDRDQFGGDGSNTYGSGAPGADQYGGEGSNVFGNGAPGGGQYGGEDNNIFGNVAPGGGQYGGEDNNVLDNEAPGGSQYGGESSNVFGNRAPGGGQYDGEGNNVFGNGAPGGGQYGGEGNNDFGNGAPGGGQYGGDQNGPSGGSQYGGDGSNQYGSGVSGGGQLGGDGSNQPGNGYPYAGVSGRPPYDGYGNGPSSGSQYGSGSTGGACGPYQWRCENGPCIDYRRRCDGRVDCPYDSSDEFDCASGPADLALRTVPDEQVIRYVHYGGDAVFRCRDEGPLRVPVRWIRQGGRPLKPGSIDRKGRLELYKVTPADSGVYICQAVRFTGYPKSEVRVTLNVETQPDNQEPPFRRCKAHEATCGNGVECIPKSATCDGKIDCSDGSDEDSCYQNGMCEPNQFQCRNHKCVLKTWLCDSENDCGDNSDEADCRPQTPGDPCLSVEFACRTGGQCIPKSFHCDGQNDCFDKSDEIGCAPIYVTQPPTPSLVTLEVGSTLVLTCHAVGMPVPLISWRLNWGHVPPQCSAVSENGTGTLTCPDMQHIHSGAYSCEAINNKGTTFAIPDSIVFVNKSDPCTPGYFNSEARSESECIRCFCFGKSTKCHSADLFLYNMPTPLGQGGTRLVGVSQTPNGDLRTDTPIGNQYHYEPLRNEVRITKMVPSTSSWSVSEDHPYVSLPESYNGKQLTSYGGHITYVVTPHSDDFSPDDSVPSIIIKGKYGNLFHYYRGPVNREIVIEARLTPENWMKPSYRGLVPASREDIMMTLDHIDMILLRADFNNAGVIISQFSMESAQSANVGLGAASLVEECTCPRGYDGLSCEKCAFGFTRKNSDPWHGDCVPETCPPGTYGDPENGVACSPCPCPLTNPGNQFASTCSLGASGDVICDCNPGYEGNHCDRCAPGYVGNPLIPGDSCKPERTDKCNPIGTRKVRLPDECVCKENVQGRYCDSCKNDSFYLSEDNRHGCALCFCSGVIEECSSSNLRRKTITTEFNMPQIISQVKVYKSSPAGGSGVRYTAPVESDDNPQTLQFSRDRGPVVYYWSLPKSFAQDKVTSYGGYLQYKLINVPEYSSVSRNYAADVQLISDNHLTFHYSGNFTPSSDGVVDARIKIVEKEWQRPDGKEISREHFLLALADVKTILIKVRYSDEGIATPVSASIDVADPDGTGPIAAEVEQCMCPTGYLGTSCEDCAPGYTRSSSGLYLKHCTRCECNGHSNMCNPETGICYSCADNTDGSHCEVCKPGYQFNAYGQCVESEATTPSACRCEPRGTESGCDGSGICHCKPNVEGENCDRCRPGTFGLHENHPLGCLSCYCSGVSSECHEGSHYASTPMAAPILGDNYGGYTLMDLNANQVISDNFVPVPNQSELSYVFQYPPNQELYWSLPVFPGDRVLSYGGSLSLRQEFYSTDNLTSSEPGVDVVLAGRDTSVFWTNPTRYNAGSSISYQVPLTEHEWTILGTASPVDRHTFMRVLADLRRVLVRATVNRNILYAAIADVSMDTATQNYDPSFPVAIGVEVCMCPAGYSGTSCEICAPNYYKDSNGLCTQCPCNGHDCQLDNYGQVYCNCRPPYTGSDCSALGLVMELHPTIIDDSTKCTRCKSVTFTCKYRAPEPLIIKFYHEGHEQWPPKFINESTLHKDGWHGKHVWHTVWDTNNQGEIYECHTVTQNGFTLGILTTSLPEPGGSSSVTPEPRPPVPQTTVVVTITSPTIKIQEVGSSVNFTCEAYSRMTRNPLRVKWSKVAGQLPLGRSTVDELAGLLLITNLQISDSGQYVCETNDGVSTAQAIATLKVPGNDMTMPVAEIRPAVNDYYVGDRIQLECLVRGNPAPSISWQRASNRPLPASAQYFDELFIIESAREEDSGEYRCIASNTLGSVDRTAIISIRPRPSRPTQERLTITPPSLTLSEGQGSTVVCTGTQLIPADSIDWVRQDGYPLSENIRSQNGVLYIDYARLDDQGVYLCQSASPGVVPAQIVVKVERAGTPSPADVSNITVSVDRIIIPTGETGTIDCNPMGYPLPFIRWSRNGGEFGPRISQRGNTLIVSNAQDEDQGYYLCEGLVDNAPVASIYVAVEIERREAPRVEIWPQGEQSVPIGSQFEFHCRTTGGIPEPALTWARGGSNRALSPHTHIRPNNLVFEYVDVNDEGEYTCSATNVAGTASASAIIKVRSPPEITITPSNHQEIRVGEPAVFECRANGYPEPMVSIKTGTDMIEIVRPSPGIAVLRVASASQRDEGIYTCTATSAAGTTQEQFRLIVDRGDGGYPDIDLGGSGDNEYDPSGRPQPPEFEQNPSDLVALDGQREVTIICNVTGGLEARWDRADRPMQRNAVKRGSTLLIYNVSTSDSGKYVCNLVDPYTGAVVKAVYTSLVVIGAPRITLRPQTQIVRPGQSPTVECVVEGDNILEVVWNPYHRSPSNRVEIRGSTLIFHRIEIEDAGKYECFARNKYANISAIAEVVVTEESDRTSSQSHDNEQYAHSGAAVHLSCNVTRPSAHVQWTKDGRPVPRSRQKTDGSLFIKLAQKSDSGHYVCTIRDQYGRRSSNYINLHIEGPRDEGSASKVSIDQPRRPFRVGENVNVLCRAKGVNVKWERYGTNEYVDSRTYGDGAMLIINGVQESDAGIYRCIATGPYGTYYDDFNLEVEPSSSGPIYPDNRDSPWAEYTARLSDSVDLPCRHNLEEPAAVEWKREFTPLPADVRSNQPILHLERVTEADAGIYVCRATNYITTVESRAVLRVEGVVPRFDGSAWLSLPSLKDAYKQFDIEISFRPADRDGLILYNSQNAGRTGDFIALSLMDGIPRFSMDSGAGSISVEGDRPLVLNAWHTIRISRTNSRLTMDVDNTGPFNRDFAEQWTLLELEQPMYIGGVPDFDQLPAELAGSSGFVGCVSMLILGREEKNIMLDNLEQYRVSGCDSCSPNLCLNSGVCQEARNELGYMCICAPGFAGLNCDRTGEACRPGLCGPGKCADTVDGYKCACPVAYTGKNCEVRQSIEYPAFTGSAYLAIKPPVTSRLLNMSMKVKPTQPVADGIIMYCAESSRGYGGFTSLAVRNGRLEFRYDLGGGSNPVVLTSNRTLPANEWTDVHVARFGGSVSLKISNQPIYERRLDRPSETLKFETPMFVGGVDDSIVLNNNTGVTGGFSGCIRDVMINRLAVDIVNSSIQSANVRECSNYERGDIPDTDVGCQCYNDGTCPNDSTTCVCPPEFTGRKCETRLALPIISSRMTPTDPCSHRPCRNGGICRPDLRNRMNHTCDCPLGFAGASCQMPLELLESVGFNGNGYIELPSRLLRYDILHMEPALIALAIHTYNDGVLLYQREVNATIGTGDYVLLRVVDGYVELEWDMGSGMSNILIDSVLVNDGERHQIIVKFYEDKHVSLSVDGYTNTGDSTGITSVMNADSNIYIGGIPDALNVLNNYPGLSGCIEQVELMGTSRGLKIGQVAVAGRNAQRCRNFLPDRI
ncbi:basement membrane-specific heparan sulfate proteoglycan core protein isoform X7 [Manduca sexta]|uniref:basement membrane-specific heparan sulfate proteoglycan core protein isoform X7 n=1 Tax=Manduca sexta TaxID=7130 RepID=UPI0018901D2E|nr:basement membrane-specific heparan sulfate proteoglycan core protein isoform X7 [Manduca sexta]